MPALPTDARRMLAQAMQFHNAGQLPQAEALYRQILSRHPNNVDALHLLGVLAGQAGRPDAAVELISRAIQLKPNHPDFHNNLGLACKTLGRLEPAIESYRRALALKPNDPDVHNNLAVALKDQGNLEQAIAHFEKALALRPNFALAMNNLGNALHAKGLFERAISCFKNALALNPQMPEAHYNLGNSLYAAGRLDQAVDALRAAIALNPNNAEYHYNLGNALQGSLQIDQAIASFERALQLKPDHALAHNNLGNCYRDSARLDEAIACYKRALECNFVPADSNRLYTLAFHPAYDGPALLRENRRWDERHAKALGQSIPRHDNVPDPDRQRLRVGYVSPDFWAQAESFFVVPLVEAHDRAEVEVHCYASVARPDGTTERLKKCADAWHDCLFLSDAELAERIRADRIDILVDLTMHMAHNRLLAFARKPAPVQVCWLAYPGTTGLSAMDYRLTDSCLDPDPAQDAANYSEQCLRVPDLWFCYDPLIDLAPRNRTSTPAEENGHITFGSFNNPCKLNDGLLRLWAGALGAIPKSRLLAQVFCESQKAHILRLMHEAAAVDPARVEFISRLPRAEYLRVYDRIDIALDTLPYNGITTTCDALWMGVPVITLTGQTSAGRAGKGILSAMGLTELIADTPERFIQTAIDLSGDPSRLRHFRANLRVTMKSSPVMDARHFARNVESAYRQIWRRWCSLRV